MTGSGVIENLYHQKLDQLGSANDQMSKVLREFASMADDQDLADQLTESASGIRRKRDRLLDLADGHSDHVGKICMHMKTLAGRARTEIASEDGDLRDIAILLNYRRMCDFGISEFGTAAVFADALGRADDVRELRNISTAIYEADDYLFELAEFSASASVTAGPERGARTTTDVAAA
ncbi:MAG: DUF892 family protein [Pacificimonas sp.]